MHIEVVSLIQELFISYLLAGVALVASLFMLLIFIVIVDDEVTMMLIGAEFETIFGDPDRFNSIIFWMGFGTMCLFAWPYMLYRFSLLQEVD